LDFYPPKKVALPLTRVEKNFFKKSGKNVTEKLIFQALRKLCKKAFF
jgi:hypothetical protein